MASIFYHNAFVEMGDGDMDITGGTMRGMLLTAHTEDVDDDFVDDISADEASGGGYARVTVTTVVLTDDDANDRAELSFDNVTFSSLGAAAGTIDKFGMYLQVGGDDTTPANDPLLALWDIANTTPNGTDFILQHGSEGAIQFS